METTAHAATWVLFQLSQHPDAEAAIERELDAAGLLVTADRPHPRALQHADLAGLAYLQAVIKARQRARRPARPPCVRLQRAVDEPWSASWLLAHRHAAPAGPARCRAVSLCPACFRVPRSITRQHKLRAWFSPRSCGRSTLTLHGQLSGGLAVVSVASHDAPASPATQRLPCAVCAPRAAVPTRRSRARARRRASACCRCCPSCSGRRRRTCASAACSCRAAPSASCTWCAALRLPC